jgi:hypothetical protein
MYNDNSDLSAHKLVRRLNIDTWARNWPMTTVVFKDIDKLIAVLTDSGFTDIGNNKFIAEDGSRAVVKEARSTVHGFPTIKLQIKIWLPKGVEESMDDIIDSVLDGNEPESVIDEITTSVNVAKATIDRKKKRKTKPVKNIP